MERMIVSLRRGNDERDLEVPSGITVQMLLQELAFALGWEDGCSLEAHPPGRLLRPEETLAQAGVRDGARLILIAGKSGSRGPMAGHPQSRGPQDQPPDQGPLRGWRPLGVDSHSSTSSDETTSPPSGGFVWKQVDED
ncbi:MAG: EsaB/YukD family protein [Thermoflexus sp.]|jgi:hypothetical protein|nr:EsaB/YukD family protein [Thermoflexus sp.]